MSNGRKRVKCESVLKHTHGYFRCDKIIDPDNRELSAEVQA